AFTPDGEMVGAAASYQFFLTLPGGTTVQVSGVAGVAVPPTHRRRGVLRALMSAQLTTFADQGDAAAVLWATEPTIYGRFGFAPVTRAAALTMIANDRTAAMVPDRGYDEFE